jgi:hypothetical protein
VYPAVGRSDQKNAQLRIINQQGGNKSCPLCGADKADFEIYDACSEAQKSLKYIVLWANGILKIGGIEDHMPLLRGNLDVTPKMNLSRLAVVTVDNLHLNNFIKKHLMAGQELLPMEEAKAENRRMINLIVGRDPIKHESLFDPQTRATSREFRGALTALACPAQPWSSRKTLLINAS